MQLLTIGIYILYVITHVKILKEFYSSIHSLNLIKSLYDKNLPHLFCKPQ